MIDTCPSCQEDLAYTVDGNAYNRAMSVEVRGVYDGGLFWRCPACSHQWHRWPIGDWRRNAAEKLGVSDS